MKIAELKKILNKTNDETLKKILVDVYKLVPTSKKQDADFVIEEILNSNTKNTEKLIKNIDYTGLSDEINLFLHNAYAQNYLAPNRNVPKKQRPKWRFHVKRFVKELEKVPTDSEFYNESVELLRKLYKMMCYACNYYLFSTDDPFKSVGISQFDFYSLLVNKTFATGITSEKINTLLVCAATGGLSSTSLYISQETILLSCLKTSEYLQTLIDQAKQLVISTNKKYINCDRYSNTKFFLEVEINNYCDVILMASIDLKQFDETIEYYFENVKEFDEEVALYRALHIINLYEENDALWVKCYEYGVKRRKIKPRDSLKETYKDLKNKQQ